MTPIRAMIVYGIILSSFQNKQISWDICLFDLFLLAKIHFKS